MNTPDFADTINTIRRDLINVSPHDINNLSGIVVDLAKSRSGKVLNENWVPSTQTVKEACKLGIKYHEIETAISTFITFARQRNYEENLDRKFITHVKVLQQSNRLSSVG